MCAPNASECIHVSGKWETATRHINKCNMLDKNNYLQPTLHIHNEYSGLLKKVKIPIIFSEV